ncbi:unnamed protein product [Clonostachys rosea f. rosea IK726]|uniref:Uncharacterized protein n=1 Tax=Clonostachys rosea f. rosea IK726 TaxID=1349383 RepID=A0ACA9U5F7_BIOOC|nr:unnamed protein product [Clonostachys rosea f. rosea IK726]
MARYAGSKLLLLATAAMGLGLANSQQASNFDVPTEVAESHSCDAICQQIITQMNVLDLGTFGTNFDFDFYATAANFSESKPGDLLKLLPLSNSSTISNAPEGVTVYKFQYTSAALDGTPVPVTGLIALPPAANDSRSNLVAFAHGTTGLYRGCAPSTYTQLFNDDGWPRAVAAGYAVVVSDFAGLGNNYTEHLYLSKAQANDVYYSVLAAQKAFPQRLSHEWVSLGHSQGGGVTWQLSEHKLVQDASSGYLGGAAVAPPTKLSDQFQSALRNLQSNSSTTDQIQTFLTTIPPTTLGLQRYFPGDYDAPLLTEKVKQRIELAGIGQLCLYALGGLMLDLTPNDVFLSLSNTDDAQMQKFQALNSPAQGDPAGKPLLVIHGSADILVSPESSKASFDASCGYGNILHRTVYEGRDHGSVLRDSSTEWIQFIADRFAGKDFGSLCTESVVGATEL